MSGAVLTAEQRTLLALLRTALTGEGPEPEEDVDWREVCQIARSHAVLPLLFPLLDGREPACRPAAEQCAAQFYRLLFLTRYYTRLLSAGGVETVVLKGPGAAWYYPVPEHRKSGDIDLLLLRPDQMPLACRLLAEDGAVPETEQHANHHQNFRTPEGIVLELHSSLTEDFDDPGANRLAAALQKEMGAHVLEREVLPGVLLPVPDDPAQAVSLLLHMLQHFLRAGFGLKLLCDWTTLWDRLPAGTDMSLYERFVDESGLRGFADMVGSVCVRCLGLPPDRITREEEFDDGLCRDFLRDVFEAEEFGRTSTDRMVLVRGGAGGYLRQFHLQTRLSYPRAGRRPLLWPFLWCAALFRFLWNNRNLRGTSLAAVLRETKRRSRLTKPLHLFERKE